MPINEKLYQKAMLIKKGFDCTIDGILLNENSEVDPWLALDEIAMFLKSYTKSLVEKKAEK